MAWCAGQVAGLVLCSACFAGAAVHRTPPRRDTPLFACRPRYPPAAAEGTEAESTLSSIRGNVLLRHPACAQKLASEVCGLCLPYVPGKPLFPAPLGYMSKAHSDMRTGQAGRSPVSQAAAQPRGSQPTASHHLGAALLQCMRLVQLLGCRVQAGTWYNQVLGRAANQGRSAMYSVTPPHPKSAGAWKVAGPTPPTFCLLLLQPALSVSGLLSPGSRSGSWSFSSHAFPPSFPSIIALFNRPARPHCQHSRLASLCPLLADFQ